MTSVDTPPLARPGDIVVERAQLDGDALHEVVELCGRSLGWSRDPLMPAFFTWKHLENPFGVSPAWVARDGDRLVGVRVLMRWQLVQHGQVVDVVRAVDTATDPDYQGRGIFSALTRRAVEELTAEGVHAVFNTPNGKSLPGYRKLGWEVLGRAPICGFPLRPVRAAQASRRRDAAERWSEPTSAGLPVGELPASLLDVAHDGQRLSTRRSAAYLAWRYRFPQLGYRMQPVGNDLVDGVVIFRLRQRGAVRELAICDALVPEGNRHRAGVAVARLARATRADVVLAGARAGQAITGLVPLPNLGPVLTWRPLASPLTPSFDTLTLSLGDLELF